MHKTRLLNINLCAIEMLNTQSSQLSRAFKALTLEWNYMECRSHWAHEHKIRVNSVADG